MNMLRKRMKLQKEYVQQIGEAPGQFESLPLSPYRMYFYSRDYTMWLEKQLIILREKTITKKH